MAEDGERSPTRGSSRGQIHRGHPLKQVPGAFKPTSSIPAKFETILYHGPREKKGFMSESKRFHDSETEQPGPGAYNRGLTMEFHAAKGVGKKGYGGLASGTKRFTKRMYYTGPGPGEYKARARTAPLPVTQAPASASFMPKTSAPRVVHEERMPGPGAYQAEGVTRVGQPVNYLSKPGHSSAFKTKGHKLILSGNADAPPPTAYDLQDPWSNKGYAGGSGFSQGGGSFGTSSRGGGAMSLGASSMYTDINKLVYGPDAPPSAALLDQTPGPGQYELQDFASIRSKLAKGAARPLAPFVPHEHIDRFGAPVAQRKAPETARANADAFAPSIRSKSPPRAPGAQASLASLASSRQVGMEGGGGGGGGGGKVLVNHLTRASSPPKGVGAPFKSRSPGHMEYMDKRSLESAVAAPGPAYYSATIPSRKAKSFHLNARREFS